VRNISVAKEPGNRGVSSAIARNMILSMVVLCLGFGARARADQAVTLAWSPDVSGSVLGYVIYTGPASGQYTARIDVGTNTSFTAGNLQPGTTNYFAVAAYTADSESLPSGELAYIVPGMMRLMNNPSGTQGFVSMQFPVAPNHWYEVQASADLKSWRTVWNTGVVSTNGWVNFKDHRPVTSLPSQFYRLQLH
jgi:hypothetical protein